VEAASDGVERWMDGAAAAGPVCLCPLSVDRETRCESLRLRGGDNALRAKYPVLYPEPTQFALQLRPGLMPLKF
jgi:hypothetical protein